MNDFPCPKCGNTYGFYELVHTLSMKRISTIAGDGKVNYEDYYDEVWSDLPLPDGKRVSDTWEAAEVETTGFYGCADCNTYFQRKDFDPSAPVDPKTLIDAMAGLAALEAELAGEDDD